MLAVVVIFLYVPFIKPEEGEMPKPIKLAVPAKAPRNGHVAVVMVRPGAGAHGKTRKAERRSDKMAIKRMAGNFPSGEAAVAEVPRRAHARVDAGFVA